MINVVVPVHNGGSDLPQCLDALQGAGVAARDIIVVDDASTDGVAQHEAGERGTRLIRTGDLPAGPALARNGGAQAAEEATVLLFIDADVVVQAGTVDQFRAAFASDSSLSAAFGSYDDQPRSAGTISRYKNLLHHFTHQSGDRQAATFWSGCGAVRREAFMAVGGFDPHYNTASIEDIDLGLRLTDAGYAVELRADIQCTHLKHWSLNGWLKTDIFSRAVPWTRLLIQRRAGVPDALNLGYRERLSALCALCLPAGLILLLWPATTLTGLLLSVGSLTLFFVLQWPLLRFFRRQHGMGFLLCAAFLHWLYFVYSSITFVLVHLAAWLVPGSVARNA